MPQQPFPCALMLLAAGLACSSSTQQVVFAPDRCEGQVSYRVPPPPACPATARPRWLVNNAPPSYPAAAMSVGFDSVHAWVQARIDYRGLVLGVEVDPTGLGAPFFRQPIATAVKNWRFTPLGPGFRYSNQTKNPPTAVVRFAVVMRLRPCDSRREPSAAHWTRAGKQWRYWVEPCGDQPIVPDEVSARPSLTAPPN